MISRGNEILNDSIHSSHYDFRARVDYGTSWFLGSRCNGQRYGWSIDNKRPQSRRF